MSKEGKEQRNKSQRDNNASLSRYWKILLAGTFVLVLIGYSLLALSDVSVWEPRDDVISKLSTTFVDGLIYSYIPDGGTYYINATTAQVTFGELARIRVFDERENLVFSLPIIVFPQEIRVQTEGYYSVILENVSIADGTDLFIYNWVGDYEYISRPFRFLNIGGGIVFAVGMIGMAVSLIPCLSYWGKRSHEKAEKFITVAKPLKLFLAVASLFVGPAATVVFFGITFSFSWEGNLVIWIVSLCLIAIYWIKIHEVYEFVLSEFGYESIINLSWTANLLLAFLYIGIAASLILLLSEILPFPVRMLFTELLLWPIGFPLGFSFLLLFPLIDCFTLGDDAFLSLSHFLSTYQSNPETAHFKYAKRASERISSLMATTNVSISPDALAEHISRSQLSDDQKDREFNQELRESLRPLDIERLFSIIKKAPNIARKHRRITFDRALQHLNIIATILLAVITTIVAALQALRF